MWQEIVDITLRHLIGDQPAGTIMGTQQVFDQTELTPEL
jgi:hypothetical protein